MAVGDIGKTGVRSALAYDVETTYGTYGLSASAQHTVARQT